MSEKKEATLEDPNREFVSWFAKTLQFAALIILAILGFLFASGDRGAGNYAVGITLSVSAILLIFLFLQQRLDGDDRLWGASIFADRLSELAAAIPILTVLALSGLLLARAAASQSLYGAGLGLFAASVLGIFLNIKRVCDRIDRSGE